MSNLSELLPSGGGAKSADFVASGTLPNGRAVVLKDNGQVELVGLASVSETIPLGSAAVFNTGITRYNSIGFVSSNTFVIAYSDQSNSYHATAIVGTVSGSSISFGSEVVFNAGTSYYVCLAADPNTANKVVIAYADASNSNYGTAIVGTVSGTTISFGAEAVFESAGMSYLSIAFDTITSGRIAVAYRDDGNNDYGTSCVGVVTGTSVSFGTPVVYISADIQDPCISFDSKTANKCVITYTTQSNGYGEAKVGTLSGTNSISFGSYTRFFQGSTRYPAMSYDPNTAGKFVVVYGEDEDYGTASVGTVSGTSISFGTAVRFQSGAISYVSMAFDSSTAGKFVVAYRSASNSYNGIAIVGTLSGTSTSYGSISTFTVNNITDSLDVAFDSANAGKFLIAYSDYNNSSYGTSILGQIAASVTNLTSTNFVGITDQAIASGASGSVVVQGGVGAGQTSLTIGSTYYVQADGTISTVSTSPAVNIGKALSATTILLKG